MLSSALFNRSDDGILWNLTLLIPLEHLKIFLGYSVCCKELHSIADPGHASATKLRTSDVAKFIPLEV